MANRYIQAYERHAVAAQEAMKAFRALCDLPVGRVPGMDTVIRLAWRIECGRTVEEAAAKEFLYRVKLGMKALEMEPTKVHGGKPRHNMVSIFGSPCLLGQ